MIRLSRAPDKSDHSLARTVFLFTFYKKLRLTRTSDNFIQNHIVLSFKMSKVAGFKRKLQTRTILMKSMNMK